MDPNPTSRTFLPLSNCRVSIRAAPPGTAAGSVTAQQADRHLHQSPHVATHNKHRLTTAPRPGPDEEMGSENINAFSGDKQNKVPYRRYRRVVLLCRHAGDGWGRGGGG